MEGRLIARGAEAEIWEGEYIGKPAIFKKRVPKPYRHVELDQRIRKERSRGEAGLLHKAKWVGIRTPALYKLDPQNGLLVMEKIEGDVMKHILQEKNLPLMEKAGIMVTRLHAAGLVHGDLTTSNMLVENGEMALVDFGLGFESSKREDWAVDVLNFKKTYSATHYNLPRGWALFLEAYQRHFREGKAVVRHMAKIEARARYA